MKHAPPRRRRRRRGGRASDDLADIARVAALADQTLVGWLYWQYKNWHDPTTQSQTSGTQSLFTDDADLSTVKEAKARILVRTYPRATAGLPRSLSFDPDTGDFHYVYEPRTLRRPTEIAVSPLHYPAGYTVQVVGGHAISAPNATLLQVTAHSGATQVEVDVRAAPWPTARRRSRSPRRARRGGRCRGRGSR